MLVALTTATNERNAAVTTRDNAISTAATTRDNAAISASNAKLTTTLADLKQEYVNNNAYGEYATIEASRTSFIRRTITSRAAATNVASTQTELADAQAANTTRKSALSQAQIALASAQSALEDLFSEQSLLRR